MSAATSASAATSTAVVTLPPSLAFLVSNFHALVNIKLDGSNYLLWRAQVESVMEANGFYGYLDGSTEAPPSQIRTDQGELTLNSEYSLWKLIDSQLRSCITASISQITLPYVLGLRTVHEIWISLSNRYNLLTETHVQELRDQLYNLSKTSTIDAYIDKIKELAQQLTAAGSTIEDDELVFRTLHGLPKAFNGLRTAVRAVRTKGHRVSFDELVTMLKSEDVQLIQESTSASDVQNSSVLVATHDSQLNNSSTSGPSQLPKVSSGQYGPLSHPYGQFGLYFGASHPYGQPPLYGFPQQIPNSLGVPYQFGSPGLSPQFGLPQFGPQQFSSTQFGFPQFGSQSFGSQPFGLSRGFSRGRGRGPRLPCDICGKSNHSTNYCYYKPPQMQYSSQFSPTDSWRGSGSSNPWGNSVSLPMFQAHQSFSPRPNTPQNIMPGAVKEGH
ncbi:hypothetical protein RHMOL_Rhmol03G0213400 [Rhododendron molle]|uniref:Uncharacterized protein n=1 Tax=Rhododendron molle TaxID=49168 RepID=A0ACC0PJ60_RHOML|nr:hypothetical protein RHMOL_Rhmol03G0213400 [Rhododendron molle]